MSDRKFGYILILLLLLLSLGAASYFAWLAHAPLETRTLRFPEVGSLSIEDPVRMSGTLVGVVSGFDHDSLGRVLVYVRTPRNPSLFKKSEFPGSIPVRTSSSATVKVKGLMGERFIEISRGDLGDPLIPIDQIIDGAFEMGPSEAVAYMDLLSDKIVELRNIILWLRDGREGERSFVTAFNDIAGMVDTLVFKLLDGLGGIEAGFGAGVDSAARIVQTTVKFTADVSAKVPDVVDDLNSIIIKVDEVVAKMDTVFTKLDNIMVKIDSNELLWGDHAEKLQKQVGEMRKIMDGLRDTGMPLRVKLKFF